MSLVCSTCDGNLTIDGVAMRGPAWCVLDLTPLWLEAPHAGTNIRIPKVNGDRARRRYRTQRTVQLDMIFDGRVNQSGVVHGGGPWVGIRANWTTVRALVAPVASSTGTRSATLTLPDSSTLSEDVQVEDLVPGRRFAGSVKGKPSVGMLATLVLTIPSGYFV